MNARRLILLAAGILFIQSVTCAEEIGTVSPSANGNHAVRGEIDVAHSVRTDIYFTSPPEWITGYGSGDRSVWYVLLSDSTVHRIELGKNLPPEVTALEMEFPSGSMLTLDSGVTDTGDRVDIRPLGPDRYNGNYLTHPVVLPRDGSAAVITGVRILSIEGRDGTITLPVNPLPDGRILSDSRGRILMLTGPDDRYAHGILGDQLEATGFAIVDTAGTPSITRRMVLPGPGVFETLLPIWTDLTADGSPEIILTRSDSRAGARIEVYAEDGLPLASGEPIGLGGRWMHLIAAAPLGPDGEIEIAAVRTPHIGGVVEYYRLIGDRLERVHSRPGNSTHRIGSRNLDMALAADLDADGGMELLLPSEDFRRLDAIGRTAAGSRVEHSISLDAPLCTNIAAYSRNGRIRMAFGTANGRVILFE